MSNCNPLKNPVTVNEKFVKANDNDQLADETSNRSSIASLSFRPNKLILVFSWCQYSYSFMDERKKSTCKVKKICDIFMVRQNSKFSTKRKKIQFCWEKVMQTRVVIIMIENQPLVSFSNMTSIVVLIHGKRLQASKHYQDLTATVQEVEFLQQLFWDLQHPQQQPTSLRDDNQSTIRLSTKIDFHKVLKHNNVKQRFFRDAVHKFEFNFLKMPAQKMAFNTFSKELCEAKFNEVRENIMGRLNLNSG